MGIDIHCCYAIKIKDTDEFCKLPYESFLNDGWRNSTFFHFLNDDVREYSVVDAIPQSLCVYTYNRYIQGTAQLFEDMPLCECYGESIVSLATLRKIVTNLRKEKLAYPISDQLYNDLCDRGVIFPDNFFLTTQEVVDDSPTAECVNILTEIIEDMENAIAHNEIGGIEEKNVYFVYAFDY